MVEAIAQRPNHSRPGREKNQVAVQADMIIKALLLLETMASMMGDVLLLLHGSHDGGDNIGKDAD